MGIIYSRVLERSMLERGMLERVCERFDDVL